MALHKGLVIAAAELAMSSPNRWELFMAELHRYSAAADTAMVMASHADVQNAQGFARALRILNEGLETAVDDYRKIKQR